MATSDVSLGLLDLSTIPHQHISPLTPSIREKKSDIETLTCGRSALKSEKEIDRNRRITLNVGGTRFETLVDTLTKHGRTTMLGAMFLAFDNGVKDEYFIDRDPELFRYILNWYRTGYLICPQGVPIPLMEIELDFYGIPRTEMKLYQKQFTLAGKKVWSCKSCGIHIADNRDVHSKSFTGKNGPAYLFNSAINVSEDDPVDREMMSGKHTICEIKCVNCGSYVGWTYQTAHSPENKFKEGKSVLEKSCIIKEKNLF